MKVRALLVHSVLAAATSPALAAPEPRRVVPAGAPREAPRHPLKGASKRRNADEGNAEAAEAGPVKKEKEATTSDPTVKMKKEKNEGSPKKDAEKNPKGKEKSEKSSEKSKKSQKTPKGKDKESKSPKKSTADTIPPLTPNSFNMGTDPPIPPTPPAPNATAPPVTAPGDDGCVLHADAAARGNGTVGAANGTKSGFPANRPCNSAVARGTTLTALAVSCTLVLTSNYFKQSLLNR